MWIPVGKVYTDEEKTEEKSKIITLGRYVFKEDGTIDEELSKTEPRDQLKRSSTEIYHFTEELKESVTVNEHAKDIATFITRAKNNHGYYIGRYEARTVENAERTSSEKDNGAGVTVRKDGYIYNWVTQPEVADLSQNMYNDSNFTSDLINSYAWDTAIVFM